MVNNLSPTGGTRTFFVHRSKDRAEETTVGAQLCAPINAANYEHPEKKQKPKRRQRIPNETKTSAGTAQKKTRSLWKRRPKLNNRPTLLAIVALAQTKSQERKKKAKQIAHNKLQTTRTLPTAKITRRPRQGRAWMPPGRCRCCAEFPEEARSQHVLEGTTKSRCR